MLHRQLQILRAVIKHFTETAEPVGSQTILVSYHFNVSPATIRNDMATLEKAGLLYQPHTSAGRVPTDLGYRLFVDELADYEQAKQVAHERLQTVREHYKFQKIKEKIYDAVSILAQATNNVSFATIENHRTFYLGIANALKQPEFSTDPYQASQIFEVLENNDRFLSFLNSLNVEEGKVQIYIGKENLIEQIQSCSIMINKYKLNNQTGFMGILGPTRMNYPVNTAILQEICQNLSDQQ